MQSFNFNMNMGNLGNLGALGNLVNLVDMDNELNINSLLEHRHNPQRFAYYV